MQKAIIAFMLFICSHANHTIHVAKCIMIIRKSIHFGRTQRSSHYTTMHRFSLIFGIEFLRVFERCLSKNCGLSRFFTLKILIFERYVFIIVLFVTLIARFLFYVVVACFSYVNHALNYPWFRVSAHVTKVALIFAGDEMLFKSGNSTTFTASNAGGLFFLLILQNTKNPLELTSYRGLKMGYISVL